MKFYHKIILAILTGLLCSIAWTPNHITTALIFIALVPLLYIAKSCKQQEKSFFIYPFLAFTVWNFCSIGWIYYASSYGAFVTFLLNAFFMSIPFLLFFIIYKKNELLALVALVAFYMAFEYLHFNWDISFPWLTFGNVFSSHIYWIQWYEYTGVAGGTLWVFIINIIVFLCLQHWHQHKKKCVLFLVFSLILPLTASFLIFKKTKNLLANLPIPKNNIVIIQPNYEAYTEKFSIPEHLQIDTFLSMAQAGMDSNTLAIVLPETALVNTFWEHNYTNATSINKLNLFLKKHPKLSIISGASTMQLKDKNFVSAAKHCYNGNDTLFFYESYNTVFNLRFNQDIHFYHKSKLVPGVEKMPFQKYLSFLDNFIIDLGGTSGALGVQDTPCVFIINNKPIAPLICYESIYGNFITDFINKGAQAIVFITNDGWWRDTDGYKQHAAYTQLRAIENRRFVYRSANTGITMVLNPIGEKLQSLEWNKRGYLKAPLCYMTYKTFYVKQGDYLYKFFVLITALIIIYFFALPTLRRMKFFSKKTCCQ